MEITGIVIAVKNEWIIVEVTTRPQCNGCKGCAGLFDSDQQGKKHVQALRGDFSPAIGDNVQLDTRPGEGSLVATLIFGFPMAGFFVGMFLGIPAAQYFGFPAAEWQSFVGGIAGLMISFLILYVINLTGKLNRLSLKVVGEGPPPESTSVSCPGGSQGRSKE